jgi:hypothetical protein
VQENTHNRQHRRQASIFRLNGILGGLLVVAVFLFSATARAEIKNSGLLEREESNVTSPFTPYRERSSQRVEWQERGPFLTPELSFRHITYHFVPGMKTSANHLYMGSLKATNPDNPLITKVGRIWTGNDLYHPVDGISCHYTFGNRVSGNLSLGRTPSVSLDGKDKQPSFSEARLRFKLNDQAFINLRSNQEWEDRYSSCQVGYAAESITALGEYRSTGATDTWRVSLQCYHLDWGDLTSDYRVNLHDGKNSGIFRNTLGIGSKKLYLETGIGKKFYFGDWKLPEADYYDGTISFGLSRHRQDNVSLGYLVETGVASEARTISGSAERFMSKNTKLGLVLAETRINEGRSSVQHLESYLHRTVYWGFYEIRVGLANTARVENTQKDVHLRAGYEF